MKTIEQLYDEFIAKGGAHLFTGDVRAERYHTRAAFMAGAAAMATIFGHNQKPARSLFEQVFGKDSDG